MHPRLSCTLPLPYHAYSSSSCPHPLLSYPCIYPFPIPCKLTTFTYPSHHPFLPYLSPQPIEIIKPITHLPASLSIPISQIMPTSLYPLDPCKSSIPIQSHPSNPFHFIPIPLHCSSTWVPMRTYHLICSPYFPHP